MSTYRYTHIKIYGRVSETQRTYPPAHRKGLPTSWSLVNQLCAGSGDMSANWDRPPQEGTLDRTMQLVYKALVNIVYSYDALCTNIFSCYMLNM